MRTESVVSEERAGEGEAAERGLCEAKASKRESNRPKIRAKIAFGWPVGPFHGTFGLHHGSCICWSRSDTRSRAVAYRYVSQ